MGDLHAVDDDPTADDKEKLGQNAVSRFFSMFQDGVIGTLYMMGKDMSGSYFIAVLTMLIDCAQLSAMANPKLFSNGTNEYLDPLHSFFNAFEFGRMSGNNSVLVPMALIAVFMMLCNAIYVGYCWVYQLFNWLFLVRLLRAFATILNGVLYIPILTVFASTVQCAGLSAQQCSIFQPFVALAVVFYIPFSLISTATFFDPRREGASGPITMPHARVALLHQFVRTVLAILAATLPGSVTGDPTGMLTFWSILMSVSSASLVYAYVWLQPYYRHGFNSLRAALASIVFWFSFCFALSGFWGFDESQHSPAVLFYGGICLFVPFMHTLLLWRKRMLTNTYFPEDSSLMFGDMESELRIRFLLEQAAADALREQRHAGVRNKQKKEDHQANVTTKAAQWYATAVVIYPKSALLCAMQAQFFIYEMDKPLLARKALLEAEARGAKLDVAFAIFKTKKYTEESASQNSDIMTWVACEKYWKLSKFYDRRCCVLLAQFWVCLGEPKLQVNLIQNLADQIAVAVREATSAYTKLIKLKPDDVEVMNIYAGFLDYVRNDPEGAQKFKTRAEVIRTRNTNKDSAEGKFNDNDCSILRVDASGTSRNGIILSANEVTGRIFNQPSSSLEGKVISSILLAPFTTNFDEIMDAYLQQGNEDFFNERFNTYVYLNEKTVMPCDLELKPFSTDGINFQVFVRVKQRSMSSQVVLVDPDTERILGVTPPARHNLLRYCALDSGELQSIDDLIRGYKQRRSEFLAPEGATLDVKFGDGVTLRIKSTHLHGPKSPLVDELTFMFPSEGEGPVPLEVYHTDTESAEARASATNALDDNANEESFGNGLQPIEEQSEGGSHEYSGSGSDRVDTGDSDFSKPEGSEDGSTAEVFATNANVPANGNLKVAVVALEDDSEQAPLVSPKSSENTISLAPSDDKSQGAPSVVSSATSNHSVAASRRVFLNSDGKLDPTLGRFRRLYRSFVFLTIIVIVCVYLIRDSQMQAQAATLDFTPKAGVRRYLAIRLAYLAHSMYLLHLDIILPSGFDEYECRKQLVKSANELQRLESMLFERKNSFSGELLDYYGEEHLWLIRIIEEPNSTYRKYSMYDASVAYASGGRFLSEKPLDLIDVGDVDIFFMVMNIVPHTKDDIHYPGFLQALNETTRLFAQLSQKTQKSMDTVSVTLAATVLLSFFLLLVVMLLPLARGIDKSRLEVFTNLISLPRSVYPAIAGRFTSRLLEVHDESDVGEVENHGGLGGGGEDDKVKKGKKGAGKRNGDTDDERSVSAVEASLRASSNKYQIIGKIGMSLILLIAYFSCTLYWNFETEHLLEDAPYVADYGSLRRATMLLAMMNMRMLETGGVQYGGYEVSYDNLLGTLNELDNIQQGLLNGDKNRHLKGMIHNTVDQTRHKELLFENGCIHVKTPSHTGVPCLEYQHGVVADGLLSGLRTWIRLSLAYLHETHVDSDAAHFVTIKELHDRIETIHFVEISDLEEFYLQPSLLESIEYYIEYEHYLFHRIHVLSLWACIFVVTALSFCFYYTTRILYQLDKEIKRTRSLVFMIPDDIVRTHPKVKSFIYELARRQAKAAR
jgi:hypothetical protein